MVRTTIQGIDVSHYNGVIDWGKVAATGVVFALTKASEGAKTQDARFQEYYEGMRQAGIIRGAYHFFHPELDAQAQAENFLKVVSALLPGDLPPALDVETGGGQSAANICSGIQRWLDTVENALGRTPILYSSASFWNSKAGACQDFARYPLWVAHYTDNAAPNMPAGWPEYTIWQYSESGTVSGISGPVDMDRFNGTLDDLKHLIGA